MVLLSLSDRLMASIGQYLLALLVVIVLAALAGLALRFSNG